MRICGLNKTTLLDYPGRVAATIFLGGCNYRCPFCHNSSLLSSDSQTSLLAEKEILIFLNKRKKILEGVCITGGEPTLSPQLPEFLKEIKDIGYSVKLDTNGTNPRMLKLLVQEKLVDKIAMDIKSSPENYPLVTGVSNPHFENIQESVDFLLSSTIEYEFRTTVVRELHTKKDFISIGKWLSGASSYYLQSYKDSPEVLIPGFHSCTRQELEDFQHILETTISSVFIRGID